jgi:deoxyhypusine synthase
MQCKNKKIRNKKKLRNGISDGFIPTKALDLSKAKSINALVHQMKDTAFSARTIGEAADVLYAMVKDPECLVVGTFSGAMTVAKMGLILCDMIEKGLIQCVVSTGALITHGLIESVGMTHFKYCNEMNDKELYYAGYDRVYDTLELEQNLDDTEEIIRSVLDGLNVNNTVLSSHYICAQIGAHLSKQVKGRGILKSAYEKKVPVFIPAFTDSELGLDIALVKRRAKLKGAVVPTFDPYYDLEAYTELVQKYKRIGIFTIGGGVPRNWAQQVGPYLDIIDKRIGVGGGFKRFTYGVRICPEPVYWGGLSGCTYSEGVTWGKFVPPSEGGRYSEVLVDATVAWPLVVGSVFERLAAEKFHPCKKMISSHKNNASLEKKSKK